MDFCWPLLSRPYPDVSEKFPSKNSALFNVRVDNYHEKFPCRLFALFSLFFWPFGISCQPLRVLRNKRPFFLKYLILLFLIKGIYISLVTWVLQWIWYLFWLNFWLLDFVERSSNGLNSRVFLLLEILASKSTLLTNFLANLQKFVKSLVLSFNWKISKKEHLRIYNVSRLRFLIYSKGSLLDLHFKFLIWKTQSWFMKDFVC